MRVPFRLAATLWNKRFAEHFGRGKTRAPMGCVSLPADGGLELSAAELSAALRDAAAVCWLSSRGHSLNNLSVAKFARRLQDAGRTVFLETDGMLLRRRIHEFRPDARLYLTIRLHGMPGSHDARMQRDGAFALAMEGLRAAQLSGFLICAHLPVDGQTDLDEVKLLRQYLRQVGVDGVVVTATHPEGEIGDALQKKASEARNLIGNAWWAAFSRLAELTMNAAAAQVFVGAQDSPEARDKAAPQTSPNTDLISPQNGANISEEVAVP
jgi:hypothetical protein